MAWRRLVLLAVMAVICLASGAGAAEGLPASFEVKITDVQKQLALDPKSRIGWVRLGNLHFDAGQPKQAVDAYQKALDLKPDDPEVLCDQGIMFSRLGEPAKAMANFDRALAINPKHGQSLYNAGIVANEQLGQPNTALKYWKKLVENDPTSPAAKNIKTFLDRLNQEMEALKAERPAAIEAKPAAKQ